MPGGVIEKKRKGSPSEKKEKRDMLVLPSQQRCARKRQQMVIGQRATGSLSSIANKTWQEAMILQSSNLTQ